MNNISQLGHFLKYNLWRDAIKLLNYQLNIKTSNRHFNTLSMFYYEKLGKSTTRLESEDYFKTYISNNFFYGLEKEFAVLPYAIPKANLGIRKYKFLTYPIRVTYYAVGLYLTLLSHDFLSYIKKHHKNVHSWYGGELAFDNKTNELLLKYNSIWYKPHYKKFRGVVRQELKENINHKIIIHLDIQNYFDEISISILLRLFNEYVNSSTQKEMNYDAVTQAEINFFFKFIAKGQLGIPQCDNDIISSYIGYIYMVFGDLFIEEELRADNDIVQQYTIIRYMDDTYISITFKEDTKYSLRLQRETYIDSLASRIADSLYEKLGLRLNTKTKLFWLEREEDRKDLERNLKRVSPGHEMPDDEDTELPQEKVNRIFRELENLKKKHLDSSFNQQRDINEEFLKEIYDDAVKKLLKKPDNKHRIKEIFTNFNFELVKAQPIPIIILLLEDPDASETFKDFLLQKTTFTSRDNDLILCYLCQTEFKSNERVLLKKLASSQQMSEIVKYYVKGQSLAKSLGYFNLSTKQILKLSQMPNVIEQIRLRVVSEQNCHYSVALNHLLNEIHAICFKLDSKAITIGEKKYDATKVLDFLKVKIYPSPYA